MHGRQAANAHTCMSLGEREGRFPTRKCSQCHLTFSDLGMSFSGHASDHDRWRQRTFCILSRRSRGAANDRCPNSGILNTTHGKLTLMAACSETGVATFWELVPQVLYLRARWTHRQVSWQSCDLPSIQLSLQASSTLSQCGLLQGTQASKQSRLAQRIENAPNLLRALLGRALLAPLVVNIAHPEPSLVALSPLEVAGKMALAQFQGESLCCALLEKAVLTPAGSRPCSRAHRRRQRCTCSA